MCRRWLMCEDGSLVVQCRICVKRCVAMRRRFVGFILTLIIPTGPPDQNSIIKDAVVNDHRVFDGVLVTNTSCPFPPRSSSANGS